MNVNSQRQEVWDTLVALNDGIFVPALDEVLDTIELLGKRRVSVQQKNNLRLAYKFVRAHIPEVTIVKVLPATTWKNNVSKFLTDTANKLRAQSVPYSEITKQIQALRKECCL